MKLKAKEWLVLASETDAIHFYGVRDPFYGMSEEEIHLEYDTLLDQLEEKHLIVRGFDDQKQIAPEIRQLLTVCIDCKTYRTMDQICRGSVGSHQVWYTSDNGRVRLEQQADEMELTFCEADDFEQAVCRSVGSEDGAGESREEVGYLTQETLSELQKQTPLTETAACSLQMAELLRAGLHRQAGYCTLGEVDLTSRSLRSLSIVYDSTGVLGLTAEEEDLDRWRVSWLTPERLKQWIRGAEQEA